MSIPFTANHTQQAFKLLEIPPELLALLESDTPPTLQITASSHPPHHAHLTISNPAPNSIPKTYTLRQKNTSNPLMLLSPSTSTTATTTTTQKTSKQEQAPSPTTPQPSITRISSISETIELIEKEPQGPERAKETPAKVNKWHEKFAQSRGTKG